MAGFDVPHITHDMILRFMGVNFSSITDGSARIPSSLGDEKKPVPILEAEKKPSSVPVPVGKTPEQDKAMWEGMLFVVFIRSCVFSSSERVYVGDWMRNSCFFQDLRSGALPIFDFE